MIPSHNSKRQYGLQPTPYDPNDFALGFITQLPELSDLPREYKLTPLEVKDQLGSDFCTAYATCTVSEMQENTRFEPSWTFAKSKELSGNKDDWGQNIRTAMKTHQKFGALPQDSTTFSVHTKTPKFLRDIDNWPDFDSVAYPFRKKSYFKVTGQYDAFDNARASLYKFGSGVVTGVNWGWPISQFYLKEIPKGGFGHCVAIVGYTTLENGDDVLILHNSYSNNAGVDGHYYISRDVYNHFANIYGAYMFVDISPEEAKYKLERGLLMEDNWLTQLLKIFLSWFK